MFVKCLNPLFSGILLALLMVVPSAALAADIYVTTLVDEDAVNSDCSLREAIVAANTDAANKGCSAGLGADTIRFQVTGTILLVSTLPTLSNSVSIIGPGVNDLVIDGDEQFGMFHFNLTTDEGNYLVRGLSLVDGVYASTRSPALHLLNEVDVVLEDAFIRGMRRTAAGGGGAIGGISGRLAVRRTTLFDNSTLDGGGGVIYVGGDLTLVVEDSLFVGNSTNGVTSDGGAIAVASSGNATIRRSTFSGNTASDDGGAIAMFSPLASIIIESSTFKGNSAADDGGAFTLNAGTASVHNSVFAENLINPPPGVGTPTSNINHTGSATLTSLGYNLIGDNEGAATAFPDGNPNLNDDYVGTAAAPIPPLLGVLADNGGPTHTHRVLANSPLIDQGSCPGELHDQRLYGNPFSGLRIINISGIANADDGCDIGAFERSGQRPEPLFLDGFETGGAP